MCMKCNRTSTSWFFNLSCSSTIHSTVAVSYTIHSTKNTNSLFNIQNGAVSSIIDSAVATSSTLAVSSTINSIKDISLPFNIQDRDIIRKELLSSLKIVIIIKRMVENSKNLSSIDFLILATSFLVLAITILVLQLFYFKNADFYSNLLLCL